MVFSCHIHLCFTDFLLMAFSSHLISYETFTNYFHKHVQHKYKERYIIYHNVKQEKYLNMTSLLGVM